MLTNVSFIQAQQLNRDIFETIYYHALKASCELAAKEGPYETYYGSPMSKVDFHFDWNSCKWMTWVNPALETCSASNWIGGPNFVRHYHLFRGVTCNVSRLNLLCNVSGHSSARYVGCDSVRPLGLGWS